MTVRHQPDAPLPYEVKAPADLYEAQVLSAPLTERTKTRAIMFSGMKKDAVYVAHACNQYPQLVAALLQARRALNAMPNHHVPGGKGQLDSTYKIAALVDSALELADEHPSGLHFRRDVPKD